MGEIKAWQWVVIVAAIGVLGVSLYLTFGRGDVKKGHRAYLIDVVSGELYVADTSGKHGVVIPAKNPESGERTIVPLMHTEDGELSVSERYRRLVEDLLEDRNASLTGVIDRSTWLIEADLDDAKPYQAP